MAQLRGIVDRITFQNEENGYTVARLQVEGLAAYNNRPATIVGEMLSINPGETVVLEGEWTTHKQYGAQFKIESYQTVHPSTVEGMRRYLGSGLIKGIGPVTAKRIVDHFGKEALDVIERDPKRLVEVEGLGAKRAKWIIEVWEDQREIHNVMLFLQSHEVGTGYAAKIWKKYGHEAVELIRENPYRLSVDVWGIGFLTADRIAQKMGIPAHSDRRIQAGLLHVLNEAADKEGHVFLPEDALIESCAEALDVPVDAIPPCVAQLLSEELIIVDDKRVYLPHLYYAEQGAATRCYQLSQVQRIELGNIPAEIRAIEQRDGVTFAPRQKLALEKALSHNLLVLTGGPGTGKTTTIKGLIALLETRNKKIALAAPTGRAAKRMSEATGHEAKTIHRLLKFSPSEMAFEKNFENPLEIEALIVDEISMVDTVLMNSLLRAVPISASVVLVGDVDQLPSVGAGNVLKDVIASGIVEVVELNEIFRQAQTSRIITNAHAINRGEMPYLQNDRDADFFFLEVSEPDQVVEMVCGLCAARLPRTYRLDSIEDIQVLVPMYRGETGANNLNQVLQDELNPKGQEMTRGGIRFRVGDKVMQVRNNYDRDVFNGDIGRVQGIEDDILRVRFQDRVLEYEFSELDELVLAYAMSVHKSQGAEFRAVVMPLTTQHYMMLQRNLLYTAITRARELVVLAGTKQALGMAVRNNRVAERHTTLSQRIRAGLVEEPVQGTLL
ncbi:MAG: ATP-dependent RecD-like DNA helicase [Gemmatimonadetes bacterium]|nr:ATP-dependent RecD-like DNA helicase [Gemmatimonadota bacterium]MYK53592.1 ATP-dependent RecD-like DNA helicase [Gemmatimonadota bacterium]